MTYNPCDPNSVQLVIVRIPGDVEIGVHPKVVKALGLTPGQMVDLETMRQIFSMNTQAFREQFMGAWP